MVQSWHKPPPPAPPLSTPDAIQIADLAIVTDGMREKLRAAIANLTPEERAAVGSALARAHNRMVAVLVDLRTAAKALQS